MNRIEGGEMGRASRKGRVGIEDDRRGGYAITERMKREVRREKKWEQI